MPKSAYRIIGLMSGTSLDGLDIACCYFRFENGKWNFEIEAAETIIYNDEWIEKLSSIHLSSAYNLALANTEYGYFLAGEIKRFIAKNNIAEIDLIASHGHTVFHQPEKKFTFQLGSGAAIAGRTGISTVSDFRSLDVALGGQGAPLVPVGDALLFPEYDYCLNLGGITNISMKGKAFDVCPCNMVLNHLARQTGKNYDQNGSIARSGKLSNNLLEKLNSLDYYTIKGAKSLGREWVENIFLPLMNEFDIDVNDKLHTVCEHIAQQVSRQVNDGKILVSGGGAYNLFLLERMKYQCSAEIVIPGKKIIEYKEALIFAFLALLRLEHKTNVLASVTGASHDNTGGCLYLGKNLSFTA